MPLRRFFIGVSNLAEQLLVEVFAYKLEGQWEAFTIQSAGDGERGPAAVIRRLCKPAPIGVAISSYGSIECFGCYGMGRTVHE